ncbi:MAG TPA: hypothetical protein VK963_02995 [Candidatus Saccharimonadales bacterium]|nr:hypothetical protein [Candidatus Saccharimonadales bacterium]
MELLDKVESGGTGRGQKIGAVLRVLGTGTLLISSLVAPNAVGAFAPLMADRSSLPLGQAERALRYAQQRGWLVLRQTDSGVEIALSRSGRLKWQKVLLDQPLTSRRWDNKWRIVIFDIPTKHKLARDALRLTLKHLGLVQLQKSVWITPHDCAKEILALRELYGIGPFVRLIEAADLEGDKGLSAKFGLA